MATQEDREKVLASIAELHNKYQAKYFPRIPKADFFQNFDVNDANYFPPGFVYEDIVEFLSKIYKIAFNGKEGKFLDGTINPSATEKTKALATKNMTESRSLMIPFLVADRVLLNKVKDLATEI